MPDSRVSWPSGLSRLYGVSWLSRVSWLSGLSRLYSLSWLSRVSGPSGLSWLYGLSELVAQPTAGGARDIGLRRGVGASVAVAL